MTTQILTVCASLPKVSANRSALDVARRFLADLAVVDHYGELAALPPFNPDLGANDVVTDWRCRTALYRHAFQRRVDIKCERAMYHRQGTRGCTKRVLLTHHAYAAGLAVGISRTLGAYVTATNTAPVTVPYTICALRSLASVAKSYSRIGLYRPTVGSTA